MSSMLSYRPKLNCRKSNCNFQFSLSLVHLTSRLNNPDLNMNFINLFSDKSMSERPVGVQSDPQAVTLLAVN